MKNKRRFLAIFLCINLFGAECIPAICAQDTVSDNNAINETVSGGDTVSSGDPYDIATRQKMKLLEKAKQELEKIMLSETIIGTVYLEDFYPVRQEPDFDSEALLQANSGQQVKIAGVEVTDHTVWYLVSLTYDEKEYRGYIDRKHLAYASEAFLYWEDNFINNWVDEVNVYAGNYSDVEQFPSSYRTALAELKKAHPNWTFVKMETGLDWNDVVDNEMVYSRSLVPSSSPASWISQGYSNSWSCASKEILEYYLDPRNFLNETGIFQFEQLTYNSSYHTANAVQNILSSTFMAGIIPGSNQTYSDIFWEIGNTLGVSPFHLACRVYQEQGKGNSPLISGNYPGYEGLYNYFNIGASGSTNEQIIKSGLSKAREQGWTNPILSLKGGARVISENYILKGQDTLYLQKFDVDNSYNGLFWHQYMQNICAPYNEGQNIRKAYASTNSLNNTFVFKIPVYRNMPASCPLPSDITIPDIPKPVSAASINYNSIRFTWNAVPDATGYYIYRKEPGGSYKKIATLTDSSIKRYDDTAAVTGITYTYTIRSYKNVSGKVVQSGYDKNGVSAEAALRVPAMKSAADKKSNIEVTWNAVSGAEGYNIYRKTASGKWIKAGAVKGKKTTTFTDTPPDAGVSYTYMVRAYLKRDGVSYYSPINPNGVTAYTLPPAPVLKKAEASGADTAKITWAYNGKVTGFYIYRRKAGERWQKLASVSAGSRSYQDKDINTGYTYFYMVRAYVRDAGRTVLGEYDNTGLSCRTLPGLPKLLKTTSLNYHSVKLDWTPAKGAEGYIIYRKKAGESWVRIASMKGSSLKSYTDKNAVTGTKYSYTVKAYTKVNGATVTGDYNRIGLTGTALPETPVLKSAYSRLKRTANITWTPSAGADGYYIYRKTEGGAWIKIATLTSGGISAYIDTAAERKTKYYYTVKAFCTSAEGRVFSNYDKKGLGVTAW